MKGSIEDKINTFKELSEIIEIFQSRLKSANEGVSALYLEIRSQGKWEDFHADNFKFSYLIKYQESLENAVNTLHSAKIHVESKMISLQEHRDL